MSRLAAMPNWAVRLLGEHSCAHCIRINDQWRVVFRWTTLGPVDVDVRDDH